MSDTDALGISVTSALSPSQLHRTEPFVSLALSCFHGKIRVWGNRNSACGSPQFLLFLPFQPSPLHTHSCSSSSCITLLPPQKAPGNAPSPVSSSHSHLSGKMPMLSAAPRHAHTDTVTEGTEPGRPRARDSWVFGGSDWLSTQSWQGVEQHLLGGNSRLCLPHTPVSTCLLPLSRDCPLACYALAGWSSMSSVQRQRLDSHQVKGDLPMR